MPETRFAVARISRPIESAKYNVTDRMATVTHRTTISTEASMGR
jgi:hypothetical protein